MERLRKDVDRNVVQIEDQEVKVAGILRDRAGVVAGAWVANGLTCIFVCALMWLASRTFQAEAALFKEEIVREVQKTVKK